jgi:hypothetical protein
MCYVIYGALILSLGVYSDALLRQYALATTAAQDQWTLVALGWELVWVLWPLLAFVAILASALTFFATRVARGRHTFGPAEGPKGPGGVGS